MQIFASGVRARPYRKAPNQQQLAAAKRAAKPAQRTRRQPTEPQRAFPDELGCPHFQSCSGCTLNHGLATPPALQSASEYFRQQGLGYQLDAGSQHYWRYRARLAVQPGPPGGRPVVGLFRQGSHEAVDIPACV